MPMFLYFLAAACSDYTLGEKQDRPERNPVEDADTHTDADTDADTAADTAVDTDTATPDEECNGVDDDGDGLVDEGFDENGNGIADCDEEEAYCTPFDDFAGWSYTGTGDWYVESGLLTEGRAGSYAGIASLYDLGRAERFMIQVDSAWGGNANDLTGIAWAVSGESAFVARWDDPQGYYGRHPNIGGVDLSWCDSGGCTPLAANDATSVYWPADMTFATWSVAVDVDLVEIVVNGVIVLSATIPEVAGTGPAVVGLYSNDNDGGVWFDNFCVWVAL